MGELSIRLHSQFAILIMKMKTPEDFRTLWTERFARYDLIRTVCMERKALRTNKTLWGRNEMF